ncbi:hypothetical protein KMP13_00345 [Epibacterium ulvae]|uniref:hypothetical protein n=1 Tax=Epibacterium ulvae TaxID=1156985 RepID=UPI001BFCA6CA|nr:hypothetical protein [Epibacterium ulvae]MBT8152372.1 hypothetical protein [Epibacterium ulvae]
MAHVFLVYGLDFKPKEASIGVAYGLVFGAIFWLGARLSTPAAFIVTADPKDVL